MDLLEHAQFGQDIIVLQTVLEEVRHRSLPLFNRLRALIAEEERRIWLFYNEARWYVWSSRLIAVLEADSTFRDTFAGRRDGETPNDRNDRGELATTYAGRSP